MWRLCALALSVSACGISFQSTSTGGGAEGTEGGGGAAFGTTGPGTGGDTPGAGGAGATTSSTGGTTSSGGAGGMGEGGSADPCEPQLEMPATVADCIRHQAPNPDECEQFASEGPTGVGEMDIDETADNTVGNVVRAYLRFDLPPGAKQATGFTLRLTNTGITNANSPGSGAIYEVQPFVRQDLFSGPPAQVSGTALAGDQGPVADNQVVDWPLPANLAQGNAVFLEVIGTDDNGVRYWNNNGSFPPKLIVHCE